MSYHWYDGVGMTGVIIILTAYLALQMGRLDAAAAQYSLLNGLGAALILISLCYNFNLSSFVIEIAWLLISLFGFVKALGARH